MSGSYLSDNDTDHARLPRGGWLALAVFLGFLGVSIWYVADGWSAIGTAGMSAFGWFALISGCFAAVAIGGRLIAMLFSPDRNSNR